MMKVFWTKFALESLSEIYKFHKVNVSIRIAQKIRDGLFYSTKQLEKHSLSGPIEEYLTELNEGHRYIVRGNYKIIYKILNSNIYITDVFDTRRNPEVLKNRNE